MSERTLGPRRTARKLALVTLFQVEVGHVPLKQAIARSFEGQPEKVSVYGQALAEGVIAHLQALDEAIASKARDWTLSRMANVDRTILRIATYELMYEPVPTEVVINEALELAKTYSTADSPRFINGVLGALASEVRTGEGEIHGKAP